MKTMFKALVTGLSVVVARLGETADGSESLETAEDNTTAMIGGLFGAAGFEDVRVVFRGGTDDLS